MAWFKGFGWLEYNPQRPEIKKTRAADDWWLVLNVPGDVCKYYSWWAKQKGVTLQLPVWRPHVTILNGRSPVRKENRHLWKKHHGEKIYFEYSNEFDVNWKFWTLPVRSARMQEIRHELGFDTNEKIHLTIGREHDIEPNLERVHVNGL